MIAGIDLGVGVDLEAKAGPGSGPRELEPREPSSRKPGVAKPVTLASFLSFTVVLLSCAVAPLPCAVVLLGAESLSDSLRAAEPREEFLY